MWFKATSLVVEHNFFSFGGGRQIGMNFNLFVSNKDNNICHALIWANDEFLHNELVLAADFNVFVGLEFCWDWRVAAKCKLAFDRAPFIGCGSMGYRENYRHQQAAGQAR